MNLLTIGFALHAHSGAGHADASVVDMRAFNQRLARSEWAAEIRAHPGEAALDPAIAEELQRAVADLPAAERSDFVTGVRAAQVKLRTGGFSKTEHDDFLTALNRRGVPESTARRLFNDPVALVTLPIRESSEHPPVSATGNTAVGASTFTDPRTGRRFTFTNTVANPGCTTSSTDPYLTQSWTALAGDVLATISYVKKWCWHYSWKGVPFLVNATIDAPPHYQPPSVNFTSWCVGCSFALDWHGEWWFTPTGMAGSHAGYHLGVQFHLHQCLGIGPISACLADQYASWSLDLEGTGSFNYDYNA